MNYLNRNLLFLAKLCANIALDDLAKVQKVIKILNNNSTNPEKIYEAILQCYLFCGFPAVIETLIIFKKHFPSFSKKKTAYNVTSFKKKGIVNCKLVYKNNFKKLIENISSYSPDLKDWMIIEGYGKVLGRSGLSILEREFLNVAILASRFYGSQLNSHLRGCMHLGATKEELNSFLNKLTKTSGEKNIESAINLLKKIKI